MTKILIIHSSVDGHTMHICEQIRSFREDLDIDIISLSKTKNISLNIASYNAKLIMISKDEEKLDEAKQEITKITNNQEIKAQVSLGSQLHHVPHASFAHIAPVISPKVNKKNPIKIDR